MDRFRLAYLKSTGLERSDFDESFPSRDAEKVLIPASPPPEYNVPETCSSETILKQAKADLKHPDPQVRLWAIKY